ncbi:MAG: hypothetical protein LAP21_03825 [Acidobacteriia bacterium]|nr:hypothetical protein [Terriglobia bacterium]
MKKKYLRRVSAGVYASLQGRVFVDMREFLAEYGIPDNPEARLAVMSQVRQELGEVNIELLEEESD